MSRRCILVDTSVLCEILAIPGKAADASSFGARFHSFAVAGDLLVLPLATILETGNHIAQIRDGALRRKYAQELVELVEQTLLGKTPFNKLRLWERTDVEKWAKSFPEYAVGGIGLGDLSIISDWAAVKEILPSAMPVSIWSKDSHLQSYGDPLE